MRKTKIVCTLGPATDNEDVLRKLMLAGMNVARLNFSHGTHEEQKKRMDMVKKLRAELGLPIAILLDTKGPEIRTRDFEGGKAGICHGIPEVGIRTRHIPKYGNSTPEHFKSNQTDTIMTNREIIRELKRHGYSRVDIDTDSRAAKTFYTYHGGVHINGTENLSFHIVPPQDSFGLGRFAICATRNGESSQLGTDHAPFFFRRLLAFLKGERKENEIIDEICNDRKTE